MSGSNRKRSAKGEKRDGRGRFLPGTAPGPGNPHVQQLSAWRSAVAETVTAADLRKVIAMLVKKAKAGEPWAVRELLDRTLGKPHQMLELTGMSTMPNVKALPADVIEDIIDARG